MKPLLLRLQKEQKSIVATLDKARRVDIQTINGRNTLRELQKKLAAHKDFRNRLKPPDSEPHGDCPEELRQLFQVYSREIDTLIRKIEKFTSPDFLASIQGRRSHQDFSRMVSRFRHKICRDEFRFFALAEETRTEEQGHDPSPEKRPG